MAVPKYLRNLYLSIACLIVSLGYLAANPASARARSTVNWSPWAQVHTELAPPGSPLIEASPWFSPLDGPTLQRVFLQPSSDWGAGHRGVDYAADEGATIRAPTDSRVGFAGMVFGRPVVTLKTGDDLTLEFEPACLLSNLKASDPVTAGDEFATFCSEGFPTHCPSGCLHVGVRTSNGGYLSIQRFVGELRPSRVKPSGEHSDSQI